MITSHSGTVIGCYDTVKCTHLLAQRTSSEICKRVCSGFICVLQIVLFVCMCVCLILIGFG